MLRRINWCIWWTLGWHHLRRKCNRIRVVCYCNILGWTCYNLNIMSLSFCSSLLPLSPPAIIFFTLYPFLSRGTVWIPFIHNNIMKLPNAYFSTDLCDSHPWVTSFTLQNKWKTFRHFPSMLVFTNHWREMFNTGLILKLLGRNKGWATSANCFFFLLFGILIITRSSPT